MLLICSNNLENKNNLNIINMKTKRQVILNVQLSEEEVTKCVQLAAIICKGDIMPLKESDSPVYGCIPEKAHQDTARQLIADLLDVDLDGLTMEEYDKLHIEVQDK